MRKTEHFCSIEQLLQEASGPLSADEVRDALGGRHIGQATVYRILKQGTENGHFVEVNMPHGPSRFESSGRDHHHHFHCELCDRVFDIEGCPKNILRLAPEGFSVHQHEILLKGHCDTCQKSEGRPR